LSDLLGVAGVLLAQQHSYPPEYNDRRIQPNTTRYKCYYYRLNDCSHNREIHSLGDSCSVKAAVAATSSCTAGYHGTAAQRNHQNRARADGSVYFHSTHTNMIISCCFAPCNCALAVTGYSCLPSATLNILHAPAVEPSFAGRQQASHSSLQTQT
jgi:hypothetical protein